MRWCALVVTAAAACGRLGFDERTIEVTIAQSAAWNAYVHADGSPCAATETPWNACSHAGETVTATLTGATECAGLKISDALGAFDWTCHRDGASVTATGQLSATMGLGDLVTASGWIPNQVIVTGAATGESEPAVWWPNPIAELPDNSVSGSGVMTLAGAGTIYVLSASRTSDGYLITAPGIAFVTLPGTTLTWNANGPVDGAFIESVASDYVWIEANLDGTPSGYHVIRISGARFAQVYRTSVVNGGANNDAALWLEATSSHVRQFTSTKSAGYGVVVGFSATADYNYLEHIGVSSPARSGIWFDNGRFNLVDDFVVANGQSDGVTVGAYCDGHVARDNTMVNVRTYANAGNGVYVNSEANRLVHVLAVGNGQNGILVNNNCGYGHGTLVVGAVAAFNGNMGVQTGDHTMTYENVVAIGNAMGGFDIGYFNSWSNIVATDNAMFDVRQTAPSLFQANLVVSAPSSCVNVNGDVGLAAGTCAATGPSTSSPFDVGSTLGDFVGPVKSDAANRSDVMGTVPAPASDLDWLAFDNDDRVWGRWNIAGPWLSGPGAILDFRLAAGGTRLLDNTAAVSAPNPAFVPGGPCPSDVDGNAAITSDMSPAGYPDQTFLVGAIEIVSPNDAGYSNTGNHDGLCESGESCLYAPNFGIYQGEGSLHGCDFHDGAVSGVEMHAHATNGI